MKGRSRRGTETEQRWPSPGRWWPICLPWIAGNGSLSLQKAAVQRLKTAEKEITGLHSAQAARSCCLPTERRRSNSGGSLRVVSGLAENTNSIFCDGPSGPQTVNGCLVLRGQEPPPRGIGCELRVLNT